METKGRAPPPPPLLGFLSRALTFLNSLPPQAKLTESLRYP